MKLDIYKKVEIFVVKAFKEANNERDVFHATRTVYWIKKLYPEADETLLTAGLAHDIERAFYGDWKKGSSNPADLRKHQKLSSLEIEKFLFSEGVDKIFIDKVKNLVLHHETGGTPEQNILCDADCLAFLEEKAIRLANKYKQENKSKEFRKKLNFLWSRIHCEKAKNIGLDWYNDALKILD